MMRSRASRFQRGRPGSRPVPVVKPEEEPAPRPVKPPPAAEGVAPPLIESPDETHTGSVPVLNEPERAKVPAPKPVSRSANLQSLEALLKESKRALEDRDAALLKVAELETRVQELSAVQDRTEELQNQLAAALAERDDNAEALAGAQQQIEVLKSSETDTSNLKQKLSASERARVKVTQEHARLKPRIATLEKKLKELMDHLQASEKRRRKAETALANAKESRNEYLFRLQAMQAIAQGDTPPSRAKVNAELEEEEAAEEKAETEEKAGAKEAEEAEKNGDE